MNIPKCSKCGTEMEKKHGRYGYFWGCKNFKNKGCRETKDIPLTPFEFEYIDYEGFIKNEPTKYLLNLIEHEDLPKFVKELEKELRGRNIKQGTIYEDSIKGKISGLFDYLMRNNKVFTVSKLAYWFYKLDGDLQGKLDYWLNRRPYGEHRKEYHVKKAFIDDCK